MKRFDITDKDLAEGIRLQGNVESLDEINSAYIERDGRISITKKIKRHLCFDFRIQSPNV